MGRNAVSGVDSVEITLDRLQHLEDSELELRKCKKKLKRCKKWYDTNAITAIFL